jgi:2-octaprenylphenol hydroxylase
VSYDVAVVGGGVVGATLGCALAQGGLRVALVEPRAPAAPPVGAFDLRVSALGLASERILRAVGAWDLLPPARLGVFREMVVWDAGSRGEIRFDAAEAGVPALGHIVENRALLAALDACSEGLRGLEWIRPARLEALEVEVDRVRLRLDRRRLEARLVVGADGTHSRVRELAGIAVSGGDYRQQAVVATVALGAGHADTAWQRFLPTGPLAFLPLPGNLASIVWSTTPERAMALLELEPDAFAVAVEEAAESRLGSVELLGERAAFPLRHLHASTYLAERVALVGDAAHTIHPLAGQGANLGLLDAAALAQVIWRQHARGRDLGRGSNLRSYERWRRGQNEAMRRLIGAFNRVFTSRLAAVRALR